MYVYIYIYILIYICMYVYTYVYMYVYVYVYTFPRCFIYSVCWAYPCEPSTVIQVRGLRDGDAIFVGGGAAARRRFRSVHPRCMGERLSASLVCISLCRTGVTRS